MLKEYLLFDLDGTLTDPKLGITTCVQYALKDQGIEEEDLSKLEPFIGPPLLDSFKDFYGMSDENAKKAVAKYRERFSTVGLYENEIYEGIAPMLKLLQSKGLHLAVASSKPTVFVEKILEHFHIRQYFQVVVGSELDGRRVNKDEVVEEALRQLFPDGKIQRDKIYMIGDRKFDVEGAKAMHIDSVGVTYGYGGMEELKAAHADYIVRSVEELQMLLLRGTDEGKSKASRFQKVWAILYQYLIFQLVRITTVWIVGIGVVMMQDSLPAFWAVRNEAGKVVELTGNTSVIVSAIGYMVAALVILKNAIYVIGKTAKDMHLTHLKEEPRNNYFLAAGAAIGAVLGLNMLFNVTGIIDLVQSNTLVSASENSANLLVGLICYGLISAVSEELLFRGVLYNYMRKFFSVKIGLVASAILFGMYHQDAIQSVYACLMGLLLAYLYEYFGDFRVPVAIHILANVLAYLLTYGGAVFPMLLTWPVCIFFLVVGAACLFLLVRQKNVL